MGTFPTNLPGVLQRIALQMTSSLDLAEVLHTITEGLVDELDAGLARIWLLTPRDACEDCYRMVEYDDAEASSLYLMASAARDADLADEKERIPMAAPWIGWIARNQDHICTNAVLDEDETPDRTWFRKNGFCSFGGYPLVFQDELLGVLAMFSRHDIAQEAFKMLFFFAGQAAIAIKNAQLFAEVDQLKNRLRAENVYLQEEIKLEHNFDEIVGRSKKLKRVLRQVEQVAPTDATVLIQGETGTGKELIARAIHNLSRRKDRPLVKVNCGAISAGLVESELFGHEKGAFTGALQRRVGRFELADGGTLFLDEVGELPLDTQVKLLRALQEGEFERVGSSRPIQVDVRVIAATNRDLAEDVHKGSFRSDLFYRLNVLPLDLPPLRESKADIPLLVHFFVDHFGRKIGKTFQGVSQVTMERLTRYSWPGNVRELQNVIERAVILTPGPILSIDLPLDLRPGGGFTVPAGTLDEVERAYILHVLKETDWVVEGKRGAALILGLHPNTLRSRMQKLGIKRPLAAG